MKQLRRIRILLLDAQQDIKSRGSRRRYTGNTRIGSLLRHRVSLSWDIDNVLQSHRKTSRSAEALARGQPVTVEKVAGRHSFFPSSCSSVTSNALLFPQPTMKESFSATTSPGVKAERDGSGLAP